GADNSFFAFFFCSRFFSTKAAKKFFFHSINGAIDNNFKIHAVQREICWVYFYVLKCYLVTKIVMITT
ncbi:hypothetical protein, partial [Xenorhabdus cabanillasii]|uniref:hypothetical protein n=1 Tax=Xenorhabdus cabanillasii TaxID=351673 RepID=UPI001E440042